MNYPFQNKSKFALLTINSVYAELPDVAFQLSDGTWVMPSVPVPDIGVWREWIGSLRMERLSRANLVFFIEEYSNNPEILDEVHQRLKDDLTRLFYMLHLRAGIEYADGADSLCGSSENGVPNIRQMSQMWRFHHSNGWKRAPITKAWLEDSLALRNGVVAMEADAIQFRRIIRGLNTLFSGLKETGQNRLHQFVRSLEALILPDIGKTKKQFVHRCLTFAQDDDNTRNLLSEVFDMRSYTEHLHPWDKAVQQYPIDQREDVCWQRARQIEHLACDAYSRILRNATLRNHFRTDDAITAFWKLSDSQRRAAWGNIFDITQEPLIHKYDQYGRASA